MKTEATPERGEDRHEEDPRELKNGNVLGH